MLCHSEIGQLHTPIWVNKYICSFDIPVQDIQCKEKVAMLLVTRIESLFHKQKIPHDKLTKQLNSPMYSMF